MVNEERGQLNVSCLSEHSLGHPVYAYYRALSCACYQLVTLALPLWLLLLFASVKSVLLLHAKCRSEIPVVFLSFLIRR